MNVDVQENGDKGNETNNNKAVKTIMFYNEIKKFGFVFLVISCHIKSDYITFLHVLCLTAFFSKDCFFAYLCDNYLNIKDVYTLLMFYFDSICK